MKMLLRAGALLCALAAIPAPALAQRAVAPNGIAPINAPCTVQVDGTCVAIDSTHPMPVAATVALPTDAARETKQDTQITAAQLTNTTLGAVTASPAANTIGDRLKAINTTLGSQATAGNQATGNASLASIDGKLPALGQHAGSGSVSVTQATDSRTVLANAMGVPAGGITYSYSSSGNGGYATPTDLVTIRATTKVVRIVSFTVQIRATSASNFPVFFRKRSTANTGGTSTNPPPIPRDSNSVAATAQIDLYTAAPTTGTSVGDVAAFESGTGVLTGTTALIGANGSINGTYRATANDNEEQITLRPGESLSFFANSFALPSGFSYGVILIFTESTT